MRVGGIVYKKIGTGLLLLFCLFVPIAAEVPPLSSASAVVMEAESGEVLYEKDAHTARPMASTTKLMTALLTAETLPLDKELTVSAAAVAVEGSALGLRVGDKITVSDLLTGLLLVSGNDAANAAALSVADSLPAFSDLMNAKAAALGMHDSHFVTPSGLDAAGHGASAYDMALLGRAVLQNDFLRQVCATKTARVYFGAPKREVWVSNHNRLLKLYDGCIGMKTGFTKRSGKCLVSAAERDGVTVVAVTLNGGDYWNDHMKLYAHAFSLLERVQLPTAQAASLPAAGGMADEALLQMPTPPAVTLHTGEKPTMQVRLPRFLWAPLTAGEKVGSVTYTCGERVLCTLPVTVAQDLPARTPLSFWGRMWKYCRAFAAWILK